MRRLLRRALQRLAVLAALAAGICGGARAAEPPDTHTVVVNRPDETLAVRDRSIVRTGDVVRFEMVSYTPEPVKIRLGFGRTVSTNFELVGIEYNCKTWNYRPYQHAALRGSDMSVVGVQKVEEAWSDRRTWWPWAGYACAANPGSWDRPRFPDAPGFAAAAAGLRKAAIEADAEYRRTHPPRQQTGWTMDGIDPADCRTAELRRAAVRDLDWAVRRKLDDLPKAQRDDALVQAVNDVCATLIILDGRDPFADPSLIPTRYWQVLKGKECWASWNSTCTAPITISVPEKFQLCNIGYQEGGRGYEYRVDVSPAAWIEGSPAPKKFRTYEVKLFASGGGRILNRTSAKATIQNLWVSYFSDKLDNAERRKRGCKMPSEPPPPPKPTPTPTLPWVKPTFQFPRVSAPERFRYVMQTPANGQSRVHFQIEVFDSLIDNRWEVYQEALLPMDANVVIDNEVLKYHATCWRFRAEYWTGTAWQPGVTYNQTC